jgi:hypothetical protein
MSAILASGKRNDWSNNDILNNNRTVEKKAVPLQAWSGPEGSRKLRFPDDNGTGWW